MQDDLEYIRSLLQKYIDIIFLEYGVKPSKYDVKFNDSNVVSFIVKDNTLYLPSNSYNFFEAIKSDVRYNTNSNNRILPSNYLNNDATYYDYIDHIILSGLDARGYFEESLLHETLHLCGGVGGNPFFEGINEFKTRELAQKYNIKIAATGYSKEVAVLMKLQEIIGKNVMDEVLFLSNFGAMCDLISNKCGDDICLVFMNVYNSMLSVSKSFDDLYNTSDPYEKARIYSMYDYSDAFDCINEYKKHIK